MKLKYTLLSLACAATLSTSAQTWVADSVSLGSGYTDDVYYNLSNGNKKTHTADDWHIAFQTTKFGSSSFNASIRANHIKGKVQVYSLGLTSSKFGGLVASDTIGKTNPTMQLVNNDTSWGEGAFTVGRNTSSQVDFGWGKYNTTTHNLSGDSLYLVVVDGTHYQLHIQEYVSKSGSEEYRFRIANFDGTGNRNDTVRRVAPYTDRLFAYYNVKTGAVIDREPSRADWDILFRQYQKNKIFGPVPGQLQAYTGVLVNLDVEVAEVFGVDPSTINSSNYTSHTGSMSKEVNTIGDDWKTFDMGTFKYRVHADSSFIIKTNSGAYFLLHFTGFDGSSTGKVVFLKKTLAASTSVGALANSVKAHSVYPNPATNQVNVMVDAVTAASTQLVVTDITGKVMMHTNVNVNKGLNAFSFDVSNYPSGTYLININGGDWKLTDKVIVQH